MQETVFETSFWNIHARPRSVLCMESYKVISATSSVMIHEYQGYQHCLVSPSAKKCQDVMKPSACLSPAHSMMAPRRRRGATQVSGWHTTPAVCATSHSGREKLLSAVSTAIITWVTNKSQSHQDDSHIKKKALIWAYRPGSNLQGENLILLAENSR